jgi:hypothetical protein
MILAFGEGELAEGWERTEDLTTEIAEEAEQIIAVRYLC